MKQDCYFLYGSLRRRLVSTQSKDVKSWLSGILGFWLSDWSDRVELSTLVTDATQTTLLLTFRAQ